jgi:hypothetical protein
MGKQVIQRGGIEEIIPNWDAINKKLTARGNKQKIIYRWWRGLASLHYGFILLGILLNKSIN